MSLSGYTVMASIAVSDLVQAAEFYERRLGLSPTEAAPGDHRIYACGGDTALHVYASPTHAGQGTATLATWHVPDLQQVVDELRANGVTFERYDEPSLETDEKGIHELADGRVAWFKDPDGNTFAIEQRGRMSRKISS
jgi:catechol 2,3-dioxygenase-like lactoylglutathione lyase family enzyme